ncbi:hypothetical protein J437_LFUL002143 [Ladona fulva]|uniref:Uncharacterized protein n=1 Tax=Ladona fulva TaxID=123851 RepID=A0A8K0NYJ1_LADFU|nr:hypothetical protein J437_LFUL002143 [Ladona fulva]
MARVLRESGVIHSERGWGQWQALRKDKSNGGGKLPSCRVFLELYVDSSTSLMSEGSGIELSSLLPFPALMSYAQTLLSFPPYVDPLELKNVKKDEEPFGQKHSCSLISESGSFAAGQVFFLALWPSLHGCASEESHLLPLVCQVSLQTSRRILPPSFYCMPCIICGILAFDRLCFLSLRIFFRGRCRTLTGYLFFSWSVIDRCVISVDFGPAFISCTESSCLSSSIWNVTIVVLETCEVVPKNFSSPC